MRVTALIADDEDAPRAQLSRALRDVWPELTVVAEAGNGADAWDAFLDREPQVCFLDVRMPGFTGIEVAQRIAGRAQVVFVTAPGDHALAAFDAGAVDYVLKPVDRTRLAQAVQRVQARLAVPQGSEAADQLQQLLGTLAAQVRRPAPVEVVQAGLGHEKRLIRVDDVIYFESDARFTRVVYREGDADAEALIRMPLKELLTQLDAQRFWQVHRSVVVNQRCIAGTLRIDEEHMVLMLLGRPERLPVSRHFQALFRGQ
jgi:DNA-binding LytR/AlgR family response regulator